MIRCLSASRIVKNFRFRLYLLWAATIALLTAAFAFFYVITEVNAFRSTQEREGRLLATVLAQNARLPLFAENREALALLAGVTARYPAVLSVSISNAEGVALTRVQSPRDPGGDQLEIMVEVTSPGLGTSPEAVLLGRAPAHQRRVIGQVRLSLDGSGARERLKKLVAAALAIGTLFWIVVSLVSYQILKRVTSSFNLLMRGIEEIGSGNLSARVDLDSDDELGRGANAINEMAASLELREMENLQLQQELLQSMKLEVQEEKKSVMARLIHTNKMTSLGLLLSSMAHEINNPNASIRFSGHIIAKIWGDVVPLLDGVWREEGEFYLGGLPFQQARGALADNAVKIVENSDRIARVVQGLRDYGVGDAARLRRDLQINRAVEAALSVLACQMQQKIRFKTALGRDLPVITGNLHQMEQVLINLIMNALQSFPEGRGEVLLTTRHDRDRAQVVVEVEDNGAGIRLENLERLFEPFFSTKLERGGSGLGLYISQYIVNEHGGRLELTSTPGEGTRARVLLPVAGAAP